MKPREIVVQIESEPDLPAGNGDRFVGYAIVGLPFRSGHVLALRRFPASSVGPGYTSVWHRDPRGIWTFYCTVQPDLGCARYFGGEVTHNIVSPIQIEWSGSNRFCVTVGAELRWEVRLTESFAGGMLNLAARFVPDAWWQRKFVLEAMGAAARFGLGTGKMNLAGKTPNGHEFITNPQLVWLVDSSAATLTGQDLGPTGPLSRQARLGDFFIPQRGLFAVARGYFERPRKAMGVRPAKGGLKVDYTKEQS